MASHQSSAHGNTEEPERNSITKDESTKTGESQVRMHFVPCDEPIKNFMKKPYKTLVSGQIKDARVADPEVQYGVVLENLYPSGHIDRMNFYIPINSTSLTLIETLERQANLEVDDSESEEDSSSLKSAKSEEMDNQKQLRIMGQSQEPEEDQALIGAFALWKKEMENLSEKSRDWHTAIVSDMVLNASQLAMEIASQF
ncbi:MAG: hypothetical protein Q9228_004244 [Teloschistes exilis]